MTWVAIVVPLILTLTLVGAGAFAVAQALRPDPQPSTATPQWQPSVDYAKQFAVNQTTTSQDKPAPTTASSSVRVGLAKVNGTWLIDRFDPL